MATLIQRYMNSDSTPGGTGITNEITGIDRAYASLAEWESNEQKDLVSADECHQLCTCNGVDTAGFSLIGWITDKTHFITLNNLVSPNGKFDDTKFYLDVTDVSGVSISQDYTIVNGFQVRLNFSAGSSVNRFAFSLTSTTAKGVIFKDCIAVGGIADPASTGNFRGFQIISSETTDRCGAVNCLSYDMNNSNGTASAGYYANVPTQAFLYYCNTYNCGDGFKSTTGMVITNGLSDSNNIDYTGSGTKTNCLSSDATGSVGLQNKDPNYVDESGKDFHLVSGSDGEDSGIDLSSDSIYPITIDVDGELRSITPSVGFDEIITIIGNMNMSICSYIKSKRKKYLLNK